MTATDLKKRAIALAEKTKIDSVTPEEVGQLSNDIVEYIENVEINGSSLGIRKTYTSVSAMEADSTAPKDDKGVLLRRGMLVNIYNQEDPDSADNGKVFSFQNPGWAFRGTVDAGYATKEELTELDNKTIQDIEKAKFDATAATEDRVLFSYEKSEAATIKFKDNFYFNVLYENAIWITKISFTPYENSNGAAGIDIYLVNNDGVVTKYLGYISCNDAQANNLYEYDFYAYVPAQHRLLFVPKNLTLKYGRTGGDGFYYAFKNIGIGNTLSDGIIISQGCISLSLFGYEVKSKFDIKEISNNLSVASDNASNALQKSTNAEEISLEIEEKFKDKAKIEYDETSFASVNFGAQKAIMNRTFGHDVTFQKLIIIPNVSSESAKIELYSVDESLIIKESYGTINIGSVETGAKKEVDVNIYLPKGYRFLIIPNVNIKYSNDNGSGFLFGISGSISIDSQLSNRDQRANGALSIGFSGYYIEKEYDLEDFDNRITVLENSTTSNTIDKTMAILGDSWTDQSGTYGNWISEFKKKLPFKTLKSYGVGGAKFTHTEETVEDLNDATGGPTVVAANNVFWNQINRLKRDVQDSVIPTPDIIFIMGDTNDRNQELGTLESAFSQRDIKDIEINTLTNFALALRYDIEELIRNFPDSNILVFTPAYLYNNLAGEYNDMMQSVCEYMGIRIFRSDKNSGINVRYVNSSGQEFGELFLNNGFDIHLNQRSADHLSTYIASCVYPYTL
jgi:hypothetical protein